MQFNIGLTFISLCSLIIVAACNDGYSDCDQLDRECLYSISQQKVHDFAAERNSFIPEIGVLIAASALSNGPEGAVETLGKFSDVNNLDQAGYRGLAVGEGIALLATYGHLDLAMALLAETDSENEEFRRGVSVTTCLKLTEIYSMSGNFEEAKRYSECVYGIEKNSPYKNDNYLLALAWSGGVDSIIGNYKRMFDEMSSDHDPTEWTLKVILGSVAGIQVGQVVSMYGEDEDVLSKFFDSGSGFDHLRSERDFSYFMVNAPVYAVLGKALRGEAVSREKYEEIYDGGENLVPSALLSPLVALQAAERGDMEFAQRALELGEAKSVIFRRSIGLLFDQVLDVQLELAYVKARLALGASVEEIVDAFYPDEGETGYVSSVVDAGMVLATVNAPELNERSLSKLLHVFNNLEDEEARARVATVIAYAARS